MTLKRIFTLSALMVLAFNSLPSGWVLLTTQAAHPSTMDRPDQQRVSFANLPSNPCYLAPQASGIDSPEGQSISPACGDSFPPVTEPDPFVSSMLNQVDPAMIYSLTGDLSGAWSVTINGLPYTIMTRNSYSGEPIEQASQYLLAYYQQLGLSVDLQDFNLKGTTLHNVVAEKIGSLFPEKVFLITSHYDDQPQGEWAPGADDNASGTVAVMLAAQIFSQYDFGCTLRFVNFAAEEQGLVGSLAYTRQTYCAKDDLEAVINLDMIAWNTPGSPRVMNIQANAMQPATLNLANFYQSVVTAYSLGLSPLITSRGTANSDQASFWGYEVPAILAIEDLNDFNPNYHTTDDQLSNLGDLTYFTEMVKASLASLAHLGCLVEDGWGTVTGTITDQHSGLPVANASVAFSNPSWDYLRSTLSQADGSFNLDLVSGLHTLRVDAPGYAPQVISNVNVTQGELTDQDIVLQPQIEWPIFLPLYIRGTVNPPPGCS